MSRETLLVAFLGITIAQRLAELAIARRNGRRLLALGAREHGRGHFPVIVTLHTLYPVALAIEVLGLGAAPGPFAPLWLALWLAAQALRYAAIRALGPFWNVRVLVLPGAPRIRTGPYRWMAHPNYAAVITELFAGPMLFGAWRTAAVFSLANLIVLAVRIRCEERALAAAEEARAQAGATAGAERAG